MLAIWGVLFAGRRETRKTMLLVSFVTMTFGLTEPLFVPEYWSPPSLFDLARRTGFDVESFVFSFAIGGIGSVLFGIVFPYKHIRLSNAEMRSSRHRFHRPILVLPFFLFPLLKLGTSWNPIYVGVTTLFVSALATLYCRPDLITKIWAGGGLFAILYFFYFGSVLIFFPDYVVDYWNLKDLSGLFLLGVPIEELLFGFSFGMYWSSVVEHFGWLSVVGADAQSAS